MWRGRWRPRTAASVLAAVATMSVLGGCGVGLEDLPGPTSTEGPTYRISARFADVQNLTLGAAVKLGGVLVGQVADITTSDYQAQVAMDIETKYRLGRDARLQIRFTTPLGDDFVAIQSAGDTGKGVLAAGAVIPIGQTRTAPGVEDTFSAISTLLNYGGLDKLHVIADELSTALHGRTGDARSLLVNLQQVVGDLDTHKADINRALDGLDRLSGVLAADTGTITTALDLFPQAFQALASDTAGLRTLLAKVGTLGTTVSGLLARSQDALLADVDNLQPTLTALQARNAELIPTLTSLTRLGALFERAAPGDYLNVSAVVDFELNANPAPRPPAGGTVRSPSSASDTAVRQLLDAGSGGAR